MKKQYLEVEVGQIVYLVFASKKERYKNDVVVKCKVKRITIEEYTIIYSAEPIKVVTKAGDKGLKNWVTTFMFENANIDTGHRRSPNRYPVFTTKEGCIKWLKG